MGKRLIMIVACIGLAGEASLAQAGLLSSTGEVIAILADELFVGEAEGHLSGAGTLAIHSQKNPISNALDSLLQAPYWGAREKCIAPMAATRHFISSA